MKKYQYKTITTTIINGVEIYKFDQRILNKEIIKRKMDGYDDYYYDQDYAGLSFEDAINILGEDGWDLVIEKEYVGIVMKKEIEFGEELEKEELKKEKEILKKERETLEKQKEKFEKEKEEFLKQKEKFIKEREEFAKQKEKETKKDEEIKKIKIF